MHDYNYEDGNPFSDENSLKERPESFGDPSISSKPRDPYKTGYRSTGPYQMCQYQREQVLKSLDYYAGHYIIKEGDRIIPQRYLKYLKEKL